MKFAIITHVPHIPFENTFQGYSAYVREMNIWSKHVDELLIVAPSINEEPTSIHLPYTHKKITFFKIPNMAFVTLGYSIRTVFSLPRIMYAMYTAMRQADHIHLRCPGTIGLLGCFMQLLFPKTPKTAKYAGNWDPKAKQPFSYRLQKRILSNTSITKNMKVLVYGNWGNQSKNIIPFFTATYPAKKINDVTMRSYNWPLRIMFVGTLAPGKRPLYAVQLVNKLREKGIDVLLDVYGEGPERIKLEKYIDEKKLSTSITLHGNQTSQIVEDAYKECHFMILPSQSEGWPKVVAEAMFWGCIPIVTAVSCVPWMLDNETRGILLKMDLTTDAKMFSEKLNSEEIFHSISKAGQEFSHQYTLDDFEREIKVFLKT